MPNVVGGWLHVTTDFGAFTEETAMFVDGRGGSGGGGTLFSEGIEVHNVVGDARHDEDFLQVFHFGKFFGMRFADFFTGLDDDFTFGVLYIFAVEFTDAVFAVIFAVPLYFAERRFDESEIVHAGIAGQVADETDVWTFRSGNRTDAAVGGAVHVTDVETSAFTGEAAGAHGGEAALVFQFSQRVGLIHEL